jgi:RNA-directed DNA polymerase
LTLASFAKEFLQSPFHKDVPLSGLAQLKMCTTVGGVAHLLGFTAKALGYVAWGLLPAAKYTTYDIPKRSGGMRTINAPIPQLKLAQQRLSDLLQRCEYEIEEEIGVKKRLAHGFKRRHSILTNADVHRRQRFVLNFDLEDFFGSIHFGRVRGFFINNRHFNLNVDVATLIAQIACHENKLPQGSPTSPVISNLVGNILDIRLAKLAQANGCAYSRYADDITISTSLPEVPASVATWIPSSRWVVAKPVSDAVHACGFRINEKKTRLQHRRSRQDVNGIVVNRHLNVNGDYRRNVRAMVDSLRSAGTFTRSASELDGAGSTHVESKVGTTAQLQGMLSFILQVEEFRLGSEPRPEQLSASERQLRRFLFYTTFANASRPLVIFEGKTDNIYIAAAIRSLSKAHPALAAAGTGDLLVKLLRSTTLMERLFGLTGGDEPLKEFVKQYHDEYRYIKGPKGANPVVAVFDNDGGAKGVLSMLTKFYKVPTPAGSQFFHVRDNLYVVLTSPLGSPSHCIEHCFDSKTLATPLSGKTLSLSNKKLGPTEYGKAWFAEKVIKPDANSIDFTGFDPLLKVISDIITSHVPNGT